MIRCIKKLKQINKPQYMSYNNYMNGSKQKEIV